MDIYIRKKEIKIYPQQKYTIFTPKRNTKPTHLFNVTFLVLPILVILTFLLSPSVPVDELVVNILLVVVVAALKLSKLLNG